MGRFDHDGNRAKQPNPAQCHVRIEAHAAVLVSDRSICRGIKKLLSFSPRRVKVLSGSRVQPYPDLVPVLVPVLDDNVVTIIVWIEYKWLCHGRLDLPRKLQCLFEILSVFDGPVGVPGVG